ncbi:TetR/AcrR family transcriptional regulator [Neorhizobium alkalisoli]|uniref:TetR family transcriptional regulator n=1 Tax=Neorhizobium alkalisoli TaxID=528178 RepID=A0A561R2G8_9HYPH|nr:TetR/AcrR family transcriptional regulator [Neorhizobium alkalisoli]TWF56753.1 TetR family transcriptional regulator [Neorhizobium alkalisoli]
MSDKNNPTRQKLIAEGLKSMIVNGFDGIGLNAILDAAGVPKGSFYYFFKSKEAFAGAILEEYERVYVDLRNDILGDLSHSPLQRLRNYFDEVERIHRAETPLGGCLYGVLSQTAATRSPEFKAKLAQVFFRWETQLGGLLEEARSAGEIDPALDTKEAAAFLIDAYEGMLVRMKVDGEGDAFDRFRRFAFGALATRKQAS